MTAVSSLPWKHFAYFYYCFHDQCFWTRFFFLLCRRGLMPPSAACCSRNIGGACVWCRSSLESSVTAYKYTRFHNPEGHSRHIHSHNVISVYTHHWHLCQTFISAGGPKVCPIFVLPFVETADVICCSLALLSNYCVQSA
jgi:hypothetical protein